MAPPSVDTDLGESALRAAFGAAIHVEPLCVLPNGRTFGIRVSGIDLSVPLNPVQARACVHSFYHHRLLCVSGQDPDRLTKRVFERFSNYFGAPVPHPSIPTRCPGFPALQIQTNVVGQRGNEVGRPVGDLARSFHADIDYETQPITATMMHCIAAPQNMVGATEVCDLLSATLELPAALREQALRIRVHRRPRAWFAEPAFVGKIEMATAHENDSRLLHMHHTLEDRRTLYSPQLDSTATNDYTWLDQSFGSEAELMGVVQSINAHATKEEYRYKHFYRVGDVFCWDNFQTMHRGPDDLVGVANMDHSQARFLHRISVKGKPSWELPRNDPQEWLAMHVAGGYVTPAQSLYE